MSLTFISLLVMMMNDVNAGLPYNPTLRCKKSVSWCSQLIHLMLYSGQCGHVFLSLQYTLVFLFVRGSVSHNRNATTKILKNIFLSIF